MRELESKSKEKLKLHKSRIDSVCKVQNDYINTKQRRSKSRQSPCDSPKPRFSDDLPSGRKSTDTARGRSSLEGSRPYTALKSRLSTNSTRPIT